MHFGQPCWKTFTKFPENFCSQFRNDKEEKSIYLSQKIGIPLDTQSAMLTSLPNILCKKMDSSLLIFWEWGKELYLFRQNFPKRSSGHEECNFDSRAKTFSTKVRQVFARNTKMLKNFILLQKLVSHEILPWTPSLHFWHAFQKFFRQLLKKFLKIKSKIDEKNFFTRNNIETFLCRRKLQFWKPC